MNANGLQNGSGAPLQNGGPSPSAPINGSISESESESESDLDDDHGASLGRIPDYSIGTVTNGATLTNGAALTNGYHGNGAAGGPSAQARPPTFFRRSIEQIVASVARRNQQPAPSGRPLTNGNGANRGFGNPAPTNVPQALLGSGRVLAQLGGRFALGGRGSFHGTGVTGPTSRLVTAGAPNDPNANNLLAASQRARFLAALRAEGRTDDDIRFIMGHYDNSR
ncbi:hypothetical protein VTL71DRAFT_84 [Oculimacula yallundae]|uniref:Uncharacterized protein n=1 Tax=Oculimacula yallundae TaxID=86028 RepID=A0ABR4CZ49_9HELO